MIIGAAAIIIFTPMLAATPTGQIALSGVLGGVGGVYIGAGKSVPTSASNIDNATSQTAGGVQSVATSSGCTVIGDKPGNCK